MITAELTQNSMLATLIQWRVANGGLTTRKSTVLCPASIQTTRNSTVLCPASIQWAASSLELVLHE